MKIMDYFIQSAFFSNEEGTSITVITTTHGAVAVTIENQELWNAVKLSGIEIAPMPDYSAHFKIAKLESQITARRLREALISDIGKEWLNNIENQIKILRNQI